MPQNIEIIRVALTNSSGTSVDAISPGFGTPDAAFFVASDGHTGDQVDRSDAGISYGFYDGTGQYAIGIFEDDNLNPTYAARGSREDKCIAISKPPGSARYAASFITDGVRLTMEGSTGLQRYCTVVLMKGVSAEVQRVVLNSTAGLSTTVSGMSFQPKALIGIGIGTNINNTSTLDAIGCLGFAVDTGSGTDHTLHMYGSQDNASPTNITAGIRTDAVIGQTILGNTQYTGEVTAWNSDGFTITTRGSSPEAEEFFFLCLGGENLSVETGTFTSPTSTGTSTTSTTNKVDALITLSTNLETENAVDSTNNAGAISVGATNGADQFSHSYDSADNVTTSNAASHSSSTNLIEVHEAGTSSHTNVVTASLDSFGANSGFTLNYTDVQSTERLGIYFAFTTPGSIIPTRSSFKSSIESSIKSSVI